MYLYITKSYSKYCVTYVVLLLVSIVVFFSYLNENWRTTTLSEKFSEPYESIENMGERYVQIPDTSPPLPPKINRLVENRLGPQITDPLTPINTNIGETIY